MNPLNVGKLNEKHERGDGGSMYKTRISKNDPAMLKQQIIHYKAEISRYEKLLKEYQDNYYYNLIDELRKENERLHDVVSELQAANKSQENEQIETQLHLIRDKSIEQLKEMKAENDRLNKEIDLLQMKIKELENDGSKQFERQNNAEEGGEQSDWFMRTLRERKNQEGMMNEDQEN